MISRRSRPIFYYLVGSGSWFAFYGIQNVLFAWLVAIVLQESPAMVGVAQSAFLLPATLFMLLGGTMSDHLGARRVAVIAQSIAVVPPLMLAGILFFNKLNLPLMIVYAASIGTLQAFITPARDAILNSVARGDIQRTVVKFTLVQFLTQMVGFAFAGTAQRIGGVPILIVQALIIALGAWSVEPCAAASARSASGQAVCSQAGGELDRRRLSSGAEESRDAGGCLAEHVSLASVSWALTRSPYLC